MLRVPTPPKLMEQFESGLIDRDELHAMMAIHARTLIAEIQLEWEFPLETRLEQWRNRHHASRLASRHGERRVREVFHALAELENFPPAALLWNASHTHVPLHCFIRTKRAPLFRVKKMNTTAVSATIWVEYNEGGASELVREKIHLIRNRRWVLEVVKRE
ncbi:MAG: hypothetical protein RI957_1524 [Verrucomicrobiota bacterium]|jgi:hypothetical protein